MKKIVYYEREERLIAIQYILKKYTATETQQTETSTISMTENTLNLETDFIYTDPKVFGPLDLDSLAVSNRKIIDVITLQFSLDEEIYLIKGTYEKGGKKNKITKMAIFTTYGQYIEFGKSSIEFNFSWEYFFNLRYFDGFIIGWNDNNISYLASLVVEKNETNYDEKNISLTDTTFIRSSFVEPMYLSPRYGRFEANTYVYDDLIKLNILNEVKSSYSWYISEICIYYEKFINCIEVEYTNRKNFNKLRSNHTGKETKKNKDKKSVLQIEQDDMINYIKISYDDFILSLNLKTFKGKNLNCIGSIEAENKIELYDASKERSVNLLGFVIGSSDRINSIQFYYEKKLI